jgi:glycine dehydrogenase subunit 2
VEGATHVEFDEPGPGPIVEFRANAPDRTAARRIDQVEAARDPQLSWQALDE